MPTQTSPPGDAVRGASRPLDRSSIPPVGNRLPGPGSPAAFLLGASVALIGLPWFVIALQAAAGILRRTSDLGRALSLLSSAQVFVSTVLYVSFIAALAVALALPAAMVLARIGSSPRAWTRSVATALIAVPLLLPGSLAYAGWGVLRGPNSGLGDWLARSDPDLSLIAARAFAVAGMALWIWPLATFLLAGPIRGLLGPGGLFELARLDAAGPCSTARALTGALRAPLLRAGSVVALIMLGSAIPLHVAQVPTYAIELWKLMQLTPDETSIWVASTPLLLLAALGAGMISRRLSAEDHSAQGFTEPAEGRAPARTSPAAPAAALVWAMAVVAPVALFLSSLQDWSSLMMFWRISGAGFAQSLRSAGVVAGFGLVLLLASWACAELGSRVVRRLGRGCSAAFLFSGLVPGVLIGSAFAATWGTAPLDRVVGVGVVPMTHLARFGFVALLGGWWLGRWRGREMAWLLRLDGVSLTRGWWEGSVQPLAPSALGIAVCMAALSLHEIESTVFVLPPGVANLPQQVLDALHYARDEQLAAAAVNLTLVGIAAALVGSLLLFRPVVKGRVRATGDGR